MPASFSSAIAHVTIASIEAIEIRQVLDAPFAFSQWSYGSRSICLVKVTASDGTVGWGEGYGPASVVRAGVDWLSQFVLGQPALHHDAIWEMLRRRTLDYARRGVLMASVSAIEIALWDLAGKLLGQPVCVLLGGPKRDLVRVYATGLYFSDGPGLIDRLVHEARGYVEQGIDAIKMKVGMDPKSDLAHVRAVRRAIGPDISLMIDANHAYALHEARRLAEELADQDIDWFEEPLSPEDYEGYKTLRAISPIPVAAGECEYLVEGFRELAGRGCIDIAQPDLCACGGIAEGARIAAVARAYGVNVAPHCWGSGIAFHAALHFTSTLTVLPGRLRMPEPILEMDRTANPLREHVTPAIPVPVGGRVRVPMTPGLGVEVDEGAIARYRVGD
jgi:D-galactarolactone cycloisomerase